MIRYIWQGALPFDGRGSPLLLFDCRYQPETRRDGARGLVDREFRTSRRALNVLSVRAGLSEQATSHADGQPGPTPLKDFQKSC